MTVKLLIEHLLEFLSLKGGCTGSPESTLVKIPHCWKSRVTAQSSPTTDRQTGNDDKCVECKSVMHVVRTYAVRMCNNI